MQPISSSTQIPAGYDCPGFSHSILAMIYCPCPREINSQDIYQSGFQTTCFFLQIVSVELLICNVYCHNMHGVIHLQSASYILRKIIKEQDFSSVGLTKKKGVRGPKPFVKILSNFVLHQMEKWQMMKTVI